ncbi:hypothetical protein Dda_4073 [Drechslerella dactyloides]|uniref:Uncharacterized protein n=1 Tax=Drechslerella dactyloides TaxID=74499 RepID=A0AAD6IZ27_DREDA|nr:hypothetical protein Dda_4073 [Drechslerella dactyloides]
MLQQGGPEGARAPRQARQELRRAKDAKSLDGAKGEEEADAGKVDGERPSWTMGSSEESRRV